MASPLVHKMERASSFLRIFRRKKSRHDGNAGGTRFNNVFCVVWMNAPNGDDGPFHRVGDRP